MSRTVLYDYVADPSDPEQLSVAKGDIVTLGENAEGGWIYVTNTSGLYGIIPASYLSDESTTHETNVVQSEQSNLQNQTEQDDASSGRPSESTLQSNPSSLETLPTPLPQTPLLDSKYAKYERLRKAGLPEGAIRHAMIKDGVDPEPYFGIAAGLQMPGGGERETVSSSENEDPRIAKYKKMEKAGLPEGAIRNAMARDGVDASVMYGGPAQKAPTISSSPPAGDLASSLRSAKLNGTPQTTPTKAAPLTPPKGLSNSSETSPLDGIKQKALERQKRVEMAGTALVDHPSPKDQHIEAGASWSPPDKSQWRPNLRKSDLSVTRQAEPAKETDFRGGLRKIQSSGGDLAAKRTQGEADVEGPPIARKSTISKKQPMPCENYRLNTTAAQFGDCICGHSKTAHQQKDDPGSEEMAATSLSDKNVLHSDVPCENYHVDVSAARFGDCKCGHSKADHGKSAKKLGTGTISGSGGDMHEIRSAAEKPCENYRSSESSGSAGGCICGHTKSSHTQDTTSPEPVRIQGLVERSLKEKMDKPCSAFKLDKTGGFGHCICGWPKMDHGKGSSEGSSSLRGQDLAPPEIHEKTAEPCNNFRVDLNASGFGVCICGHSGTEHGKRKTTSDVSMITSPPKTKAAKPCTQFTIDLSAASFDTCACGHSKAKHGVSHYDDNESKANSVGTISTEQVTPTAKTFNPVDVLTGTVSLPETMAETVVPEKLIEQVIVSPNELQQELSLPSVPVAVSKSPIVTSGKSSSPRRVPPAAPNVNMLINKSRSDDSRGTGLPQTVDQSNPMERVESNGGLQNGSMATGEEALPTPAMQGPRRTAPPPPMQGVPMTVLAPQLQNAPIAAADTEESSIDVASKPRRPAPQTPFQSAGVPSSVESQSGQTSSRLRAPPAPPSLPSQPSRQAPPLQAHPGSIPPSTQHRSAVPPGIGSHVLKSFGSSSTPVEPNYLAQPNRIAVPPAAPPNDWQQAAVVQPPTATQPRTSIAPPPPIAHQMTTKKWACERCTYENEPSAMECLICEKKRSDPVPRQNQPLPQQFQQPLPNQAHPNVSQFQQHSFPTQFQQPFQPQIQQQPQPPFEPQQFQTFPRQSQGFQQQSTYRAPPPSTQGAEWSCPKCTYLNPAALLQCDICTCPRPQMTAVPQQQVLPGSKNPFETFWG